LFGVLNGSDGAENEPPIEGGLFDHTSLAPHADRRYFRPETFSGVFCNDPDLEALAFPDLFITGDGSYHSPSRLNPPQSYAEYAQTVLSARSLRRCQAHPSFIFHLLARRLYQLFSRVHNVQLVLRRHRRMLPESSLS
jgi:hypothetical protein